MISSRSESEEQVVLLDEALNSVGTMAKSEVHNEDTPLHLAFSCYVFNQDGGLLLTRRALTKRTWAGVWTNSFCGHPQPEEPMEAAVRRRALQELGLELGALELADQDFRYRAVDASGIVENEWCPVYVARAHSDLELNPAEVMDYTWAKMADVAESVRLTPWAFSPWLVEQIGLVEKAGLAESAGLVGRVASGGDARDPVSSGS